MGTLAEERVQFEAAMLELFAGMNTGSGGGTGTITPTRQGIINYVKAKLDELVPEAEGLSFSLSTEPNVSNPYDLLINAHLEESTKDVILSAPLSAMKPVQAIDYQEEGRPSDDDNKIGYFILPDNFLRLHSFKMKEWKRQVMEAITPQHPLYKRQSNPFLRGGVEKPVAVIKWENIYGPGGGEGEYTEAMKRVIEYYSVESSHIIERLYIIQEQLAEDFITDNPMLMDSLAWTCAGKILHIIGMTELAKMAMERVKISYNNL